MRVPKQPFVSSEIEIKKSEVITSLILILKYTIKEHKKINYLNLKIVWINIQ